MDALQMRATGIQEDDDSSKTEVIELQSQQDYFEKEKMKEDNKRSKLPATEDMSMNIISTSRDEPEHQRQSHQHADQQKSYCTIHSDQEIAFACYQC